MDISVLNPFFYPYGGGTENVLMHVYKRLSKKHNITIISGALNPKDHYSKEEINGIEVIRLKSDYYNIPGAPLPFLKMYGLKEAILHQNSQIYHINNRYQYFNGTIRTIKSLNARLALTIHNSLPKNINMATDTFGLIYDVVWGRKIMHAADLITCVSKNAMLTTVPKADLHKAVTIYNGVDSERYKKRSKRQKIVKKIINDLQLDGFTMMNNARFIPQKGHIYTIAAFERFTKKNDAHLLLVGKGPMEKKIKELIILKNLQRNVSIIGGLKEEEMPHYYNTSDLFLFPSLYEPCGLALLEGLSSELPTIASKIGGIPEVMGSYGKYMVPRNIENLYNNMNLLYEHPDYRNKIAKGARKRMVEIFNWDKIAKEYEEYFYTLSKN